MLSTRILSALVLAPIAMAVVYVGGWVFAMFWLAAAVAVLWEWITLATKPGKSAHVGVWIAAGLLYAAALALCPIALRSDPDYGIQAILFLFAVVWTTDICGYFGGRTIGGPKLARSISPSKTWSGGIAGLIGSAAVVAIGAYYFLVSRWVPVVVLAVVLSVVSQLGDLGESALKRMFGAKDASQLIPGHGGVMDRLDGFWAAALLATIVGLARGGFTAPAQGLLIW